jgi:DNA-binding response OmpR family regulator
MRMNPNKRALLVEDDYDICELVKIVLRSEGFATDIVHEGNSGLDMAMQNRYSIIILDIMLPGMSGWDICKKIRDGSAGSNVPIVMLTAKNEESDKVHGLEIGADDYISKPFSPRELLARVKALMRRVADFNDMQQKMTFGNVMIDTGRYVVEVKDKPITLTPKEFELLVVLTQNEGQTMSRDQLLQKIWGYDYFGDMRTIDEHVKRIRQKISKEDKENMYIHTVWGVGYKFEVKRKN